MAQGSFHIFLEEELLMILVWTPVVNCLADPEQMENTRRDRLLTGKACKDLGDYRETTMSGKPF